GGLAVCVVGLIHRPIRGGGCSHGGPCSRATLLALGVGRSVEGAARDSRRYRLILVAEAG
ncbi:MAG: hypothetical protein LAT58_14300, partial [Opitutales bacterium]|nr:hypothetical protein [Opitutales bacterium]